MGGSGGLLRRRLDTSHPRGIGGSYTRRRRLRGRGGGRGRLLAYAVEAVEATARPSHAHIRAGGLV